MTYREVLGKGKKTGAKEQKTAVVRRRFIFQSRKARDTHTHTQKQWHVYQFQTVASHNGFSKQSGGCWLVGREGPEAAPWQEKLACFVVHFSSCSHFIGPCFSFLVQNRFATIFFNAIYWIRSWNATHLLWIPIVQNIFNATWNMLCVSLRIFQYILHKRFMMCWWWGFWIRLNTEKT